jgi:hypothetical protein
MAAIESKSPIGKHRAFGQPGPTIFRLATYGNGETGRNRMGFLD